MTTNVIALPNANQEISVLSVHPLNRSDLKTIAFIDVQDRFYRIRGIAVVRLEKGAFVSFPKRKSGGKWFDIVEVDEPRRTQIIAGILAASRVRELLK